VKLEEFLRENRAILVQE
jgi:hypothetical protein